jgi:plasmid stability protein
MPNVLIRDLDEELLTRLKKAAEENGRSLQAEIHAILKRADMVSRVATIRLSEKWLRRLAGTKQSDSAELIREDRERS